MNNIIENNFINPEINEKQNMVIHFGENLKRYIIFDFW